MALEVIGNVQPSYLVDASGNPARVALSGGVFRLFVDALVSSGTIGTSMRDDTNEAENVVQWLATRSALSGLDVSQAAGAQVVPVQAVDQFIVAAPGRDDGYVAVKYGRRFMASTDPSSFVAVPAAFAATTPRLLLRQAAATKRVILRSITLSVSTVLALRAVVVIDTADRFSAGGTSVTPANTNASLSRASGITSFLEAPTATAAGGGTRTIANMTIPGVVGAGVDFQFEDGIFLGTTGALLVYLFGDATAAMIYSVEWEEIT